MAVVLVAQVLAVLLLSDRSPVRRREPATRLGVAFLSAPTADSALAQLQALADPTLFALPSARGFAGAGWRQGTEFTYQSRDWTEPLHWLTNRANLPALGRLGDQPASSRPVRLEKPDPRVSVPTPVPLPVPERTTLQLAGAIGRRGLRSAPELPSIVHSNLLEDTIVRVAVQADGYVFSAAIARSSGLPGADHRALEIGRAIRLEPERTSAGASGGTGLHWGELVFRWRVVPGAGGVRR